MRQYAAAKELHPDALLLFRMGDFYELFFEDAKTAARELQLTLTARDRERAVPMCGVPYHAAEGYITRLLRKGYRVAICEQMEEPGPGKKVLRREVTRVLTPGTAADPALAPQDSNFLCAAVQHGQGEAARIGVAVLDLSTGDFTATELAGTNAANLAADELARIAPRELLLVGDSPLYAEDSGDSSFTRTAVESWAWTADYAVPLLLRTLGAASLDGFGLNTRPAAACAAGALLHYVKSTQPGSLAHLHGIRAWSRNEFLELDSVTVRNLELVEPLFTGSSRDATLFHALDACHTAMGKRMLRATILQPLLDAAAIAERLESVAALHSSLLAREEMREALSGIADQERLLSRVALETSTPREVAALAQSLARTPRVRELVTKHTAPAWQKLLAGLHPHTELCALVARAVSDAAPLNFADGGVIRSGYNAELDELRTLQQNSRQTIAAMEERERQRTGIHSLKVRFNSVFGYYIEITKSNLNHVPGDYERKQTLVNAERFTTPELKEYETRVLTAEEQCLALEKKLFAEVRLAVLAEAQAIRETSRAIAEADLLTCFAHLAAERGYVRPVLSDDCVFEAAASRHPVVEQLCLARGQRFVPNDIFLDARDRSILLITGPNMGGKSTYLRQAALLLLMAQMGSFVPAASFRFAPADRIYTRIGAADNVLRGASTFMVEMTETATILNTATDRSLILLDEMGRGTATFDGLSLAWATLEYLHRKLGARTLFATHYHELTLLAEQLEGLRNLHVTCRESREGIVFLHSIEDGAASKSYGIEVARLAGLPDAVLRRAREVLREHESAEKRTVARETDAPQMQMTMFTPLSQRIVDRLRGVDLNALTPLQAMNLLGELQTELEERP